VNLFNSKQVTSHEKNAKTFHKLISLVKLQANYVPLALGVEN
jgi:hypothetical protein